MPAIAKNECPTVSVIIPVYNVAPYLETCLQSVVVQELASKEVILIDDGSTDGSGEICDRYASQYDYIKVIHKSNGGLSSTRNRGLDEATGEWVVFLDSDDLWSDGRCLSTIYGYTVDKELDIVRFEYQAVDENLLPIEPRIFGKDDICRRVFDNATMVHRAVAGEWFAVLFMIRRCVLEGIRFDENVRFQEDIDFYCRLFAQRELRCGYLPAKYYLYRKHTGSITTTPHVGNLAGSFRLCDVFYQQSLDIADQDLKAFYVANSVMMYYWTLQTLASPLYFGSRKDIISQLGLNTLQKRVAKRAKTSKIAVKYRPFVSLPPYIALWLMYFKDRISEKLHEKI